MRVAIRMFLISLVITCSAFSESSDAAEFRYPLNGPWKVIQGFGVYNNTWSGYHLAEDAVALVGDSVSCAADGTVKYAGTATGYSGLVIIQHTEICTLYGHLSKANIQVTSGQEVKKGDVLGYIANPSEYSNDPDMPSHIHFGIRKGMYTDERFCGHWAYVGYSQECEGVTHKQYLAMWTEPSDFITSKTPRSMSFSVGEQARVLPDIGLKLRSSHQITADDSNKTGLLPRDALVTILDHSDNGIPVDGCYWWHIQYGDEEGWCAEADYQMSEIYLSSTAETPTPPGAKAEIKVENADVVWEVKLTPSKGLVAAARPVPPRIIVEYADSSFSQDFIQPVGLSKAAKPVLARIIVEYADSLFSQKIQKPEGMEGAAKAVTPRIIVEYADSCFSRNLTRYLAGGVAERTLSITSAEVSSGSNVTVHLNITDAAGVSGGDVLIKYDATFVTVGEIKGADLISGMTLIANTDAPGEIKLGMAGTQGIPSGSGALVDIDLTVNASARPGSQTTLELSDAEIYHESGAVIPVNLENGVVKITELAGIKGDVNNDGKVRSNDAILALRIATGLMTPTDEQQWAADMNGDGRVRSNDAILILRKATGLAAPSIAVAASASRQLIVTLAEGHGVAGGSVTAPLKVDNTVALAGGDICIAYDPTVLRAVDVASDSSVLLASNVARPGIILIAFASDSGLKSKTLAIISFNILTDDISPLTLKSVALYRPDALPIDSRKINGKFTSWAIPPEHSALLQNFPNPFNPDTWLPYQLKEGSEVAIRIFSVSGELVRELKLGYKPAGLYTSQDRAAYWDGCDESGEQVASGVYFYTIQAGSDFTATKKMVVAK